MISRDVPIFPERMSERGKRRIETACQRTSNYGIPCIATVSPVFYLGRVHEKRAWVVMG
jgi:hypothetical protein